MSIATLVYPHQLFAESPAVAAARAGGWPIYLVEESFLLTYNPIHRQKLIFHKLTLDSYQNALESDGHKVVRLSIHQYPDAEAVFNYLKDAGCTTLHIVDTTDNYLEKAISASGIQRVWYESPLFLLSKAEAEDRLLASKRFMASFYKQLRKDRSILMTSAGQPVGGKWSFDEDNRKKLPKRIDLPEDIILGHDSRVDQADAWATELVACGAEVYGKSGCWLPTSHAQARRFLEDFLRDRFVQFGPYEDAMSTRGARLFHSALSPLLNVGLLTAEQVLDAALEYAARHEVPLNSLEGFVRQILGWREFIRASYEVDGASMRSQNFWEHDRALPATFWDGTTGMAPIDHVIHTALEYGYTHHIERLMVMGNFLLLCQVHPEGVYRWFMGMYLDAYDWVMVPNVYGMSQFADGGSFATKPYISGANYIKKMSDFGKGEWEAQWTALYWQFIATHEDVFAANHRLSMMPRLLARMKPETRQSHLELAQAYLATL
ncbi:MAG: cryptochrome/photolyase family protein [Pseudomonadota bacterium]